MNALVQELSALWANPTERLQNIASTDVTLMDELNGVGMFSVKFLELLKKYNFRLITFDCVALLMCADVAHQRQADDSMSEYSAVTQQSTLSRSSARSDSSRYSTK